MKTKEYTIISPTLNNIAKAVNALAEQGWIVTKMTDPVHDSISNGQYVIVMMERDKFETVQVEQCHVCGKSLKATNMLCDSKYMICQSCADERFEMQMKEYEEGEK